MITLTETENGLNITIAKRKKTELKEFIKEERRKHGQLYVAGLLDSSGYLGNGWDEISPEKIQALTEAPIIGHNIGWDDNGEVELYEDSKIYWYPNYQMWDPWEELLKEGEVFFNLV